MHTIKSLQRYIQQYYPHYLQRCRVDIVDTDECGAVFGYPSGRGNTGLIRFIPYTDGTVGVQEGEWHDIGKGVYEWYEVDKWPDVDAYMMMDAHQYPLDKPAKPLNSYRRY